MVQLANDPTLTRLPGDMLTLRRVVSRNRVSPPIPRFVQVIQMQHFAAGVKWDGRGLGWREWRNFARDSQYLPLQQFMLDNGLLKYKNGKGASNGYVLTNAGETWIDNILSAYGPPLAKSHRGGE